MTIKMVAVDMDGTFLDSQQEYDRARFNQIYQKMLAQDIEFVVASGNQYYQLKSFFPEIADDISFVAENGAYVVSKGNDLFNGLLERPVIEAVLKVLLQLPEAHIILCGKKSAYIRETEPAEFVQYAQKYYHRLEKVPDLLQVTDDQFFKFALNVSPKQLPLMLEELTKKVGSALVPVSSGHEDVDLIIPGIHKAHGLQVLREKLGLEESELIAFGDSGNDQEMLVYADQGYAMGNAQSAIKEVADEVIATNDEAGVLEKLEELFGS